MYKKNNIFYPSVTEIIRQASKFRDQRPGPSAAIGTYIHYHILKRYGRVETPITPIWNVDEREVNSKIDRALQMWSQLKLDHDVIGVERVFYDDELRYAGRVDMLSKNEDEQYVIEIKTGDFYEEYLMQIAAYMDLTNSDRAMIILLDVNAQRNPNSMPNVIEVTKRDVVYHYRKFLELREQYKDEYEV
ncbi:MAG: hypothetical protein BPH43C_15 [Phage 5P_1]|nr:MAG: hypothetical protein BPH43C_15 [Phage 5P_1]